MSFYTKPAILQNPALLHSHGLIEAAAGTGKTYTIAHLVVELILNNVPIQDVLVVTFTDKAASELKHRIRQLLIELINYQTDDPAPADRSTGWLLTAEAKQQLTYALEDIDLATIATIHGFCNRVLSEYAFENARPFDQTQVSPDEGFRQLFGPFLQQLLADEAYPHRDLLTYFISVKHNYADWLYTNIKSLIGINPAVVLPQASALEEKQTWLNFAARFQQTPELVDRIAALNINARSRTSQVEKAQYAHDQLDIIDIQDWIAVREWATQCVFDKTKGLHLFTKDPDDIKFNKTAKDGMLQSLAELGTTIHNLIDIGQGLKEAADIPIEGLLLADLFPRWQAFYKDQKANRGWFDFDDMIAIVAEHIDKDNSILRRELQNRYSHALIDEFQDTDLRQWTIFKAIFLDREAPETTSHKIYLIGDPKQAIYSFRGADIHTYLAAAREVTRQGLKLHLDTNYRSSQDLMTAFNAIFRHPSLFKAESGITYHQDIKCGSPAMTTNDQQALTFFMPPEPQGDKRTFFGNYRKHALPIAMAAEIKRLLSDPDFKMLDKNGAAKSLNPRDIAILVNTRNEAELVGDALRQHQIPHAFYKQAGLFETDQARQLYDVLEAVLHPRNDDALNRALLSDFFDIPLETLLQHRNIPDSVRQQVLTWRELAIDDEDFHSFDALFNDTHIFERLMLLHGDERAITNYRQLADLLLAESNRRDFPQLLTHFNDYRQGRIKTEDDLLRLETEREAVQIMTIHVSKGLQYPVVFVYGGFSQGGGGGSRYTYHDYYDPQERRVADLSAQHEAEHRAERQREAERLYYVALTRAEQKLYLPHFPKGQKDSYSSFNGKYAVLRESLEALRQNSSQVHEIQVPMPGDSAMAATYAADYGVAEPSTWPNQLPAPPELPTFDHAIYRKTVARNPVRISSYTKLSRGNKSYREGIEQHRQERAGAEDEIAATPTPNSKLRGRDFGIAVHEVLEEIDALQIAKHPTCDAWQQDATAMRTLATLLHPHNLADAIDDVAPLIWHAATAKVPPGLAVAAIPAADRLAEVDFYMYLLARNRKQVYLQGSIDLVYRYQGRYFFADWKSDYLDDYHPDALAAKVETNYRYQFLIYTEATLRWLGITDQASYEQQFGGLLYLFVRGMDKPDHGIYFQRPTWQQTRQQLQDLEHENYD